MLFSYSNSDSRYRQYECLWRLFEPTYIHLYHAFVVDTKSAFVLFLHLRRFALGLKNKIVSRRVYINIYIYIYIYIYRLIQIRASREFTSVFCFTKPPLKSGTCPSLLAHIWETGPTRVNRVIHHESNLENAQSYLHKICTFHYFLVFIFYSIAACKQRKGSCVLAAIPLWSNANS